MIKSILLAEVREVTSSMHSLESTLCDFIDQLHESREDADTHEVRAEVPSIVNYGKRKLSAAATTLKTAAQPLGVPDSEDFLDPDLQHFYTATLATKEAQMAWCALCVEWARTDPQAALPAYLAAGRETAGLSMDRLAEQISISQAMISNIEKGERKLNIDVAKEWGDATGYAILPMPVLNLSDGVSDIVVAALRAGDPVNLKALARGVLEAPHLVRVLGGMTEGEITVLYWLARQLSNETGRPQGFENTWLEVLQLLRTFDEPQSVIQRLLQ